MFRCRENGEELSLLCFLFRSSLLSFSERWDTSIRRHVISNHDTRYTLLDHHHSAKKIRRTKAKRQKGLVGSHHFLS